MDLGQTMANPLFFAIGQTAPGHQTEDWTLISEHQLHIEDRILILETVDQGNAVDAGTIVEPDGVIDPAAKLSEFKDMTVLLLPNPAQEVSLTVEIGRKSC